MGDATKIYVGPAKIEWSADDVDYSDVGYTTGNGFRLVPEAPQEAIESDQTMGVLKKYRPSIRQFIEFSLQETANLGLLQNLMGWEQSPGSGIKYSPNVGELYLKATRLAYTGAAKVYKCKVFEPEPGAMGMGKTPEPLALRYEEVPTNDADTGDVTFGSFSAS